VDDIAQRLEQARIVLPPPPAAAGSYRRAVVRGGVGCVSGQFPFVAGKLLCQGRVGAELSIDEGRAAAALAALNVLAQIRLVLGGWERFAGLLRLEGHVASAENFVQQPAVLDGASELLVRALGEPLGAHARTAYHAARLPLDSPVELAVSFSVLSSSASPQTVSTTAKETEPCHS
jgi:enamine deaminase RidA (YjgF/YER057c/UK114 family)